MGGGGELQASQGQSLSQGQKHKQSGEGWPGWGSCPRHGLHHPIAETEDAPWVKTGSPGRERSTGSGVRSRGFSPLFTRCVTSSKSLNLSRGNSFTCRRRSELVSWCPRPILG